MQYKAFLLNDQTIEKFHTVIPFGIGDTIQIGRINVENRLRPFEMFVQRT